MIRSHTFLLMMFFSLTSICIGCAATQTIQVDAKPLPAELRKTHQAIAAIFGDNTDAEQSAIQPLSFDEESLENIISTCMHGTDIQIAWHASVDRDQLLSIAFAGNNRKLQLDAICAKARVFWHVGVDALFVDGPGGQSLDVALKFTYTTSSFRTFQYEPALKSQLTKESILARLSILCSPRSMSHINVSDTQGAVVVEAYAGEHVMLIDWLGAVQPSGFELRK